MSTRFEDRSATARRQKSKATALARTRFKLSADAAAFVELAPGQVIGGNYELLSLAGQGGMGSVYKARHLTLNRNSAVKFLSPSIVSQETWRLFQKEARLVSTLSHPTICQIYDLGIHAGCLPYYAMDFIDGYTLDELITRQGPLSVGATIELFLKVLEGLSYAHRHNIVHKDIKPANIMIEKRKTGSVQLRILDFGIAELTDQSANLKDSENLEIIGSAAYMSTEHLQGLVVDKTADIYSVGCSIFETLTGSVPFEADSFAELLKLHKTKAIPLLSEKTGVSFPLEMEAVLKKCLHQNKQRRYQTAGELAIDLQRIMEQKELQFARDELATLSKQTKPELLLTRKQILVTLSVSLLLFGCLSGLYLNFYNKASLSKVSRIQNNSRAASIKQKEHLNEEKSRTRLPQIEPYGDELEPSNFLGSSIIANSNLREVGASEEELKQILSIDWALNDAEFAVNYRKRYLAHRYAESNGNSSLLNVSREGDKIKIQFPSDIYLCAFSVNRAVPKLVSSEVTIDSNSQVSLYFGYQTRAFPTALEEVTKIKQAGARIVSLELAFDRLSDTFQNLQTLTDLREVSFFNSLTKCASAPRLYEECPVLPKDLKEIDKLKNLVSLGLPGANLKANDLRQLNLLRKISTFKIKGSKDIADVIVLLKQYPNVKELWIIDCGLRDSDLEALSKLTNIERLRIRRSLLTPDSVALFCQMPNLKSLYLDTKWLDKGNSQEFQELKNKIPDCHYEPIVDFTYLEMFPNKPMFTKAD